MATNIFQEPSKTIPRRADNQIVRVDFEKPEIAGVAPTPRTSGSMSIQHVPNAGSKT
jgi:hypothetical protein